MNPYGFAKLLHISLPLPLATKTIDLNIRLIAILFHSAGLAGSPGFWIHNPPLSRLHVPVSA